MRKYRSICIIGLIFILFFSSVLTVYADDVGANAGGEDGVNAGAIFDTYGWRVKHSGWLVYIIDGNKQVYSDVAVCYSSTEEPPEAALNYCYTRFGGQLVDYREPDIKLFEAPFGSPYGTNQEARGSDVKQYMLSEAVRADGSTDIEMVKRVEEIFGTDMAQEFVTREDLYLILEPIAWFGYLEGGRGVYAFITWVVGTAHGIARFEKMIGNTTYGNISFKTYTNSVFPKCCMLEYSMLGLQAPGATGRYVTNDDIINKGYGILIFWKTIREVHPDPPEIPGGGDGVIEPGIGGDMTGDEITMSNLYRIRNYARGFDISVAIPSDETVINEMKAYAFYATGIGDDKSNVVSTMSYLKPLTTTYTYTYPYYWTVLEQVGTREELVSAGGICDDCKGSGSSGDCADCGSSSTESETLCLDCDSTVISDTGGYCEDCGGKGQSCAGCGNVASNFKDITCPTCYGEGGFESTVCRVCGETVINDSCRCVGPDTSTNWDEGPLIDCPTCKGNKTIYACPNCESTSLTSGCDGCGGDGRVYGCAACGGTNIDSITVCSGCGGTDFSGMCGSCEGEGSFDAVYETVPVYEEVEYSEDRTVSYAVSILAQVKYQVVNSINLYGFKQLSVINNAFEDKLVYDESNVEIPQTTADIVLYSNNGEGNASYMIGRSEGVTVSDEYHYFIPDLEEKSFRADSLAAAYTQHLANVEVTKNAVREASWSRNDRLAISSNGISYEFMSDDIVAGCIIDGEGMTAAVSESAYGVSGITLSNVKPPELEASLDAYIPRNTNNGLYKTRVEVIYEKVAGLSSSGNLEQISGKWSSAAADNIYDHVMEGLERDGGGLGSKHTFGSDFYGNRGDGYHVMVHTPVLSLINVLNEDFEHADTPDAQLLDVDGSSEYFLKLDGHYYIEWDTDLWRSSLYGDGSLIDAEGNIVAGNTEETPEGYEAFNYDRFVENKYAKFPFDVYYDGKYYYTKADGYTEWITLRKPDDYSQDWYEGIGTYESNNHWQLTPFYIPSWAEEKSGEIRVKVDAINKEGRYTGSEISPYVDVMNQEQSQYTAETDTTAQTSGWVYGFTVVGINDKETYVGYNGDAYINDNDLSFASRKLEKIAGNYNRVGIKVQRFLKDDTISTDTIESYNTLPFRRGSNPFENFEFTEWHWYDHSGEWSVGTGVSFLIKTIGEYNGEDDYIEIKPVYKYLYPDGTILGPDEIRIAFIDYDSQKYLMYSDADVGRLDDESYTAEWFNSLSFSDGMLADSFKKEWITYTTDRYNKLHNLNAYNEIGEQFYYMLHGVYHTKMFTPGFIRITEPFRLFTGRNDELAKNSLKYGSDVISYEDWNDDGIDDDGLSYTHETEFKDSMQTWYGAYYTPGTMNVYSYEVFRDVIEPGTPHAMDDREYAFTNGKLILGFEITVYKDGVPHLSYADMWQTEGYTEMTTFEYFAEEVNPIYNSDAVHMPKAGIIHDEKMIEYGDIAVINLRKRYSDRFDTGLWALD